MDCDLRSRPVRRTASVFQRRVARRQLLLGAAGTPALGSTAGSTTAVLREEEIDTSNFFRAFGVSHVVKYGFGYRHVLAQTQVKKSYGTRRDHAEWDDVAAESR